MRKVKANLVLNVKDDIDLNELQNRLECAIGSMEGLAWDSEIKQMTLQDVDGRVRTQTYSSQLV